MTRPTPFSPEGWARRLVVMEFEVLGPLRVCDDDRAIDLGGPKQRTVLALLLASVGRIVPADVLLMETYGPDVDPRVRRSVQTWISGYRRSFGLAIDHRSGGYVLDIDRDVIDAHRFEQHIVLAREMKNDAMARAELEKALSLWKGRPFGDLEPTDTLAAESRRLEALWDEAIHRRILYDLDAGRHHALVPELERLVSDNPHHEGLRAHHMVALYRCGRQKDALRSYRDAERLIQTDLGLDPSPSLQDLELRILEHDHALDYLPTASLRAVPARFSSFVGRGAEIRAVGSLIEDHRLVTIIGPGGVGKSSLGAEVVRSLAVEIPSAFVPFESNRESELWRLVGQSIGVDSGDDIGARIVNVIGDRPLLLLLDGCEHDLDSVMEVSVALLTRCPNVRVLVTSREALGAPAERVFALGPLDHGEGSAANELLLDRAGLRERDLGTDDLAHITRIASDVSGLPLGLELAAARARTLTLAEVAQRLTGQMELLSTTHNPVRHHYSIVSAIDLSYDLLDDQSKETFERLGAFPTGTITVDAAAAVLGTAAPLEELVPLVNASLILRDVDEASEFYILEPIRQYAERKLVESGLFEETRLRYARWMTEVCEDIFIAYLNGDLKEGTVRLGSQAPSIAAVAQWAVQTDHPDLTLRMVAGVGRLWQHVATPDLLIHPAMAAMEAIPTDISLQALAHVAFLHTPGRPDEALALLQRLVAEYESAESVDPLADLTVASVRSSIPWRINTGRWMKPDTLAESRHWLNHAVKVTRDLGFPTETHLYNRALHRQRAGDIEGSNQDLRDLRDWAGEERPVWRALALHVLAKRQALDGQPEEGLASAAEAARLFTDAGDLDYAAEAEGMMAYINVDLELFTAAQESIVRIDAYHAQIDLPPVASEEPDLDALVAAGLGDWARFLDSARAFVASAPAQDQPAARTFFMKGEPGHPSRVVSVALATIRYLVAHNDVRAASRLVQGIPEIVRSAPDPQIYENQGLPEAVSRLAALFPVDYDVASVTTEEEAFSLIELAVNRKG